MLLSEFDFELPEGLIAQQPLANRADSRMLVVDRSAGTFTDRHFAELPEFLSPNDVVVLNNTKVFPARLLGRADTGAAIEIFLVEEMSPLTWLCLARPARRLKTGKRIVFSDRLSAEVSEKRPDGRVVVNFTAAGDFYALVDEAGRTPLPPYIKRGAIDIDADRERYQTVYASKSGAIAAPTAGLHFTPDVLERVGNTGAEIAEVTLHVGYGTFEPVRVTDLSEHSVAAERFEISDDAAKTLNDAKRDGKRLLAIGTTTTRALESSFTDGEFRTGAQTAGLTITPGYHFKAVDAMLTNFHLPKSSLLVLVSTFAGHRLLMDAYAHAVASRYRFYSYGDCMLVI